MKTYTRFGSTPQPTCTFCTYIPYTIPLQSTVIPHERYRHSHPSWRSFPHRLYSMNTHLYAQTFSVTDIYILIFFLHIHTHTSSHTLTLLTIRYTHILTFSVSTLSQIYTFKHSQTHSLPFTRSSSHSHTLTL